MPHPYSQIPELLLSSDATGVVRIPAEQDVPFSPRIRALVDAAEFQRLRHVTQLALASRVYPGAVHTRFEHALGVYHNALRYLWELGLDEQFAATVSQHDAEVLIVSALLHDIGHWPFCHPIEDMALPDMPPHESFAQAFLGPDSELTHVLQSAWDIDSAEVLQVLDGDSPAASDQLRRSILSGPIDIDKMDYLVRDSQHCGVPYGRHFDRNRLISSLVVNASGDGLAISDKGRTAAEMMVFARYVMFSEVYWHHAVRSATCMFARAFFELHGQLQLDDLFRLTESELIRTLATAASGTDAERLINGVFGTHRALYKRLAEYSVYHEPELYQSVRTRSFADAVALSQSLANHLRQHTNLEIRDTDLVIDAPPLHREVEFHVDVRMSRERCWKPLQALSPIVDAMARTQFDDCVKKVRVFVNPRLEVNDALQDLVTGFLHDELNV
jgi:HD superfamily phosphohydrolase